MSRFTKRHGKKLSILVASMLLCLLLALAGVACGVNTMSADDNAGGTSVSTNGDGLTDESGDPAGEHEHTFDNSADKYSVTKKPTCIQPGLGMHQCTVCGEWLPYVIPADGISHLPTSDGTCEYCGKAVVFTSEEDPEDGTVVVKGLESSPLTEITIPGTIGGKNVKIEENAFVGYEDLEKVTIENGALEIGAGAFAGCSALSDVVIPDSVTSVGADAFKDTSFYSNNLKSGAVYVGTNNRILLAVTAEALTTPAVAHVAVMPMADGGGAFTVDANTEVIADEAFNGLTSLKSVTLSDGLVTLGQDAFKGCTSLESVVLPTGVANINALGGLGDLADVEVKVYYRGTGEWPYGQIPENVTVWYYSDGEPTTAGDYWHEDEGVKEWAKLTSLTFSGEYKTNYLLNEALSTEELTVTANFNDGTTRALEAGDYTYEITDEAGEKVTGPFTKTGTYTVTFTYRYITGSYEVVVSLHSYTVTIEYGNGAPNGSEVVYENEDSSENYTLPAAPARNGYTFTGWLVNGQTKQPAEKVTISADTTITAQWEARELENVTFALGDDAEQGSAKYEVGALTDGNYTITITGEPTRAGYRFDGWTATLNGNDVTVSENKITVPLDDNMTVVITAKWTKVYTVTVVAAHVTITDNPDGKEYAEGESFSFTLTVAKGYKLGSVKNGESDVTLQDGKYTVTVGTENITITVTTTEVTVTATVVGADVEATVQKTEDKAKATITVPNPTKTGYTFDGWTVKVGTEDASYPEEGGLTIDLDNEDVTVTFTAKWTAKTPTVSFNLDNGTHGTEEYQLGELTDGNYTITVSGTPTREGYRFDGWTATLNGEPVTVSEQNTITVKLDDNMTVVITAKWVEQVTVTLVKEDSTNNPGNTAQLNVNGAVDKGTSVTLTVAVADGYSVTVKVNGQPAELQGTTYTFEADQTSTVTVTFTQNEYRITFAGNDHVTCSLTEQKDTYHYGETVTLTVEGKDGYIITNVTIAGAQTSSATEENKTYSITFGASDVTVTFEVVEKTISQTNEISIENDLFILFVETNYTQDELRGLKLLLNGTQELSPQDVHTTGSATRFKMLYDISALAGSEEGTSYALKLKIDEKQYDISETTLEVPSGANKTYKLSMVEGTLTLTITITVEKNFIGVYNGEFAGGGKTLGFYLTQEGFTVAELSGTKLVVGDQELSISNTITEAARNVRFEFDIETITTAIGEQKLSLKIADKTYPMMIIDGINWTSVHESANLKYQLGGNNNAQAREQATLTVTDKSVPVTYTVTIDPNYSNGTVELVGGKDTYSSGDTVTLKVTANPEYKIGSVKLNQQDITSEFANTDSYEITVTENIIVYVTFVKEGEAPEPRSIEIVEFTNFNNNDLMLVKFSEQDYQDIQDNVSYIHVNGKLVATAGKWQAGRGFNIEQGGVLFLVDTSDFDPDSFTIEWYTGGSNGTGGTLWATSTYGKSTPVTYSVEFKAEEGDQDAVKNLPEKQEEFVQGNLLDLNEVTEPTKDGYKFVGWYYKTADGEEMVSGSIDPSELAGEDNDGSDTTLTLYAKFEEVSVQYEGAGSAWNVAVMSDLTISYGQTATYIGTASSSANWWNGVLPVLTNNKENPVYVFVRYADGAPLYQMNLGMVRGDLGLAETFTSNLKIGGADPVASSESNYTEGFLGVETRYSIVVDYTASDKIVITTTLTSNKEGVEYIYTGTLTLVATRGHVGLAESYYLGLATDATTFTGKMVLSGEKKSLPAISPDHAWVEDTCSICGAIKYSADGYTGVLELDPSFVNVDTDPTWQDVAAPTKDIELVESSAVMMTYDKTRDETYADVWVEFHDEANQFYTFDIGNTTTAGWGVLYESGHYDVKPRDGFTLGNVTGGQWTGHIVVTFVRTEKAMKLSVEVYDFDSGELKYAVDVTSNVDITGNFYVRLAGNTFWIDNIKGYYGTLTKGTVEPPKQEVTVNFSQENDDDLNKATFDGKTYYEGDTVEFTLNIAEGHVAVVDIDGVETVYEGGTDPITVTAKEELVSTTTITVTFYERLKTNRTWTLKKVDGNGDRIDYPWEIYNAEGKVGNSDQDGTAYLRIYKVTDDIKDDVRAHDFSKDTPYASLQLNGWVTWSKIEAPIKEAWEQTPIAEREMNFTFAFAIQMVATEVQKGNGYYDSVLYYPTATKVDEVDYDMTMDFDMSKYVSAPNVVQMKDNKNDAIEFVRAWGFSDKGVVFTGGYADRILVKLNKGDKTLYMGLYMEGTDLYIYELDGEEGAQTANKLKADGGVGNAYLMYASFNDNVKTWDSVKTAVGNDSFDVREWRISTKIIIKQGNDKFLYDGDWSPWEPCSNYTEPVPETSVVVSFKEEGVDDTTLHDDVTVTGDDRLFDENNNIQDPTKDGFQFLYWYYKSGEEEIKVEKETFKPSDAGDAIQDGELTLYAKFAPVETAGTTMENAAALNGWTDNQEVTEVDIDTFNHVKASFPEGAATYDATDKTLSLTATPDAPEKNTFTVSAGDAAAIYARRIAVAASDDVKVVKITVTIEFEGGTLSYNADKDYTSGTSLTVDGTSIGFTFSGSVKIKSITVSCAVESATPDAGLPDRTQERVDAALDAVVKALTNKTISVAGDVHLPATSNGVALTWSTENETYKVEDNVLKITALPKDDDVTVTLTVTADGASAPKTVDVTIKKEVPKTKTATFKVSECSEKLGWVEGNHYFGAGTPEDPKIYLDENRNIDAKVTSTATTYTGAYTDKSGTMYWQLYESESAKITFTANFGAVIESLKITFANNNNGCIKFNTDVKTSGEIISVNASSVELAIGRSSGNNNGRVDIKEIEVVFSNEHILTDKDYNDIALAEITTWMSNNGYANQSTLNGSFELPKTTVKGVTLIWGVENPQGKEVAKIQELEDGTQKLVLTPLTERVEFKLTVKAKHGELTSEPTLWSFTVDARPEEGTEVTKEFDLTTASYERGKPVTKITEDGEILSVAFSKGGGSTAPAYYDDAVRCYANNYITFDVAEGYNITEIIISYDLNHAETFTINEGDGTFELSGTTGTWKGCAGSVVLVSGGKPYVQNIKVTYVYGQPKIDPQQKANEALAELKAGMPVENTLKNLTEGFDLPALKNAEGYTVEWVVTAGSDAAKVTENGGGKTLTVERQENDTDVTLTLTVTYTLSASEVGTATETFTLKVKAKPKAGEAQELAVFLNEEKQNQKHSDGTSVTTCSFTSGSYTLEIADGVQLYKNAYDEKGNLCLRLGSSKKVGSFSFTVPSDVKKVILSVSAYKTSNNGGQITVNNGDPITISATSYSNNGTYDDIEIDTSSIKTIKISTTTSKTRCMISKIVFMG